MLLFAADQLPLPLPPGHHFPAAKYPLLRQRVVAAGLASNGNLRLPEPASDGELGLAHTPEYIARVTAGALSTPEIRRIGLPWSPELVERSRRSVGGTLAAARAALDDGVAVHLAGGTHHARADAGAGFCVFNDTVVAARTLQAEGRAGRFVVLDCDVHQGDGTAALAASDRSIFTFSIHGARNYPYRKVPSDLDVGLPDGTGDDAYLAALGPALEDVLERADADLAFFLAGADPYVEDRYGRMALSKEGLERRDRMVLEACRRHNLPVAVSMAGGYARQVEDIADIHLATARLAAEVLG